MENFECSICYSKFEDPIECLKCNNNFCRAHVSGFKNRCPLCKNTPFKYRDNKWLSRAIENVETYKCILCKYEGDENAFWSHLIECHRKEIIKQYNENSESKSMMKQNQNNKNNGNSSNQDEPDFPSINEIGINGNLNLNNFEENSNNSRFNLQNDNPSNSSQSHRDFPKRSLPGEKNSELIKSNKLHYCKKNNELIKCDCCPDHVCRRGNCLCVKCMKYNIKKLNLEKGALINRAGNISLPFKEKYFCGKNYEMIFENVVGLKFKKESTCKYPYDPCNDCKVLTKFKDIYLDNK